MEYEKLRTAANKITLPENTKQRIVNNCKDLGSTTGKEFIMKTDNQTFFRKHATILTVLAICLTFSVSALAAGHLHGYFLDITNWQGAIVGISYEQATDEIGLSVTVNGNELTALATFFIPQDIPYRETEKLGIAAYRIMDASGTVVQEGTAESNEVVNGYASITIKLDDIDSGKYTLIVTSFVSEKNADQPMTISGYWECPFTK